MRSESVAALLTTTLGVLDDELLRFRRDIHRNPELAWEETRTTDVVAERLAAAGLVVRRLNPTGLVADIGVGQGRCVVGLRADIDALPLMERTYLPFRSRRDGVSHACGHDVHATALLGAGLALQRHVDELTKRDLAVRLIFQPAEETMPGGGRMVSESRELDGVDTVFALHCDPRRLVGEVGIRPGPITAASDRVVVRLKGAGGHTSRPHLTADLTYALAKVVTDVPAAISRRLDPRATAALVWGSIHAGNAPNVIPDQGEAAGTLRMMDPVAWQSIGPLLSELVHAVIAPYGVTAELLHTQGVPPVVNSPEGAVAVRLAAREMFGVSSIRDTEQSMGGEDFAWILKGRRGALARLGTGTPGGRTYDLHRGDLVIDEKAVGFGARLLAALPFAARDVADQERSLRA